MHLSIVNFYQQDLVSPATVKSAVQALPREHYESIKMIRYDPYRTLGIERAFLKNEPESLKAKGTYFHDWQRAASVVIIYPFKSIEVFLHTLYHEIGHHVFFRVLDQNLRNQWFAIRKTDRGFVSFRAQKNSKEDFAETYACCCFRTEFLSRVPKKADFMLKTLFNSKQTRRIV